MNENWQAEAERQLGAEIVRKNRLSGGDFAESYCATLSNDQLVFIKTHQQPPQGFFTTEAQGLLWLRESGAVNVPRVLAVSDEHPLLAIEWVNIGHGNAQTEIDFGRELAALHLKGFSTFGRPDGRTTGSQAVPNNVCASWSEFYATQRLLPLAKLAFDKQALSENCITMLEQVSSKLELFGAAEESACLLHGDLWAGNRVVDVEGKSWMIDPASHGGHREFDLAMMQLFGGYGQACFDAYNDTFPLQSDWKDRVALHQLAPLIVHAIKFGGSYRDATQQALEHYI